MKTLVLYLFIAGAISATTIGRKSPAHEKSERDDPISLRFPTLFLFSKTSSPCNRRDHFAPCACRVALVNMEIHRGTKVITIEFPEFACDKEENEKRMREGRIAKIYECVQLKSSKMIYRDVKGREIKERVHYKGGCELRNINPLRMATIDDDKNNTKMNNNGASVITL